MHAAGSKKIMSQKVSANSSSSIFSKAGGSVKMPVKKTNKKMSVKAY